MEIWEENCKSSVEKPVPACVAVAWLQRKLRMRQSRVITLQLSANRFVDDSIISLARKDNERQKNQ